MNLYETIKAAVTTRQAAESFGLAVDKHGMAKCPFHDDHHPSLKLDKRYYCFACGASGDVIDFTARFFGISVHSAAIKLARDFGIDPRPPTQMNIPAFLESSGYIRFEEGCQATSVHIYTAYLRWCKDNLEKPLSANTFKQYLKQHADKYGIVYSKHVLDNHRGFHNILVLIDPNKPGALDGAFFEEQQNQAPYAPFLP